MKNTSAHIIKGCGGCSIVTCIYAEINSHGLFPFRDFRAASVGKLFFAHHRAENTVDERRILCRGVFLHSSTASFIEAPTGTDGMYKSSQMLSLKADSATRDILCFFQFFEYFR